MSMNKPEGSRNSSYETERYLPDNPAYLNNEGVNMICQLANQLYREGLTGHPAPLRCSSCDPAPEIKEQFVAAKVDPKEQLAPVPYSSDLSSYRTMAEDTQQFIKQSPVSIKTVTENTVPEKNTAQWIAKDSGRKYTEESIHLFASLAAYIIVNFLVCTVFICPCVFVGIHQTATFRAFQNTA